MADRIFPTHVNEDPLDSEMVFQGINWDNFNNKLAEVKEAGKTSGTINPGLQKYLDDKKKNASDDGEEDGDKDVDAKKDASVQDIIDALPESERKKLKTSSSIVFSHPSQLSADAVEAAIAAGDAFFTIFINFSLFFWIA